MLCQLINVICKNQGKDISSVITDTAILKCYLIHADSDRTHMGKVVHYTINNMLLLIQCRVILE